MTRLRRTARVDVEPVGDEVRNAYAAVRRRVRRHGRVAVDRVPAVEVHRLVEDAERARVVAGDLADDREPSLRRPVAAARRDGRDEHGAAVANDHEDLTRLVDLDVARREAVARHDLRRPGEPLPERGVGDSCPLEPLRLLERVDGLLRVRVEHRSRGRRRVAEGAQPLEEHRDERALVAVGDRRRAEGDADTLSDVAVALGRQHVDGNGKRRG